VLPRSSPARIRDVDEIRRRLTTMTRTARPVVSSERLEDGLRTLGTMPSPQPSMQEERVTPGLAFGVSLGRGGPLVSNEWAVLHRLGIDIVAVWTLDLLDGSRLDRDRRRGGWGQFPRTSAGRSAVGGRLAVDERWTACVHALRRRVGHPGWRSYAKRSHRTPEPPAHQARQNASRPPRGGRPIPSVAESW
jgi:hypothetical protein